MNGLDDIHERERGLPEKELLQSKFKVFLLLQSKVFAALPFIAETGEDEEVKQSKGPQSPEKLLDKPTDSSSFVASPKKLGTQMALRSSQQIEIPLSQM